MSSTGPTWVSDPELPDGAFPLWTLYNKETSDFPGEFVLRKGMVSTEGHHPTNEHFTCDALEPLVDQAEVQMGLMRVSRCADDDPVIICTYL